MQMLDNDIVSPWGGCSWGGGIEIFAGEEHSLYSFEKGGTLFE